MKTCVQICRALVLSTLIIVPASSAAEPEKETAILVGPNAQDPVVRKVPPPKQRNWKVKRSTIRQVSGRSVTIQEVEPPLIEKPAPQAAPAPKLEQPIPQITPEEKPAMCVIGVSATVYGAGSEKRTRLAITSQREKFHAWSNIDFRHMAGLFSFRANGREYFILMGLEIARDDKGNPKTLRDALKEGCPTTRALTSPRASFRLAAEKQSAKSLAREILHDLHTLYRQEKTHLTAAFNYRQRKAAEQKSADPPPPPKPVTIRFWKRDMQKENKDHGQKEHQAATSERGVDR